MLQQIKKKSLRKQINKALASRDTSQVNATVQTIGFLVHEDFFKDTNALYNLAEQLPVDANNIQVFTFFESKKKVTDLAINQVYNKNFTWRGDLQNKNAITFLETPFDVLIGYYNFSNMYMDAMVARSKAKFKVGLQNCDISLFDLIIDLEVSQVDSFKTELHKYLTILNKL